jgi:hypothetical protein
LIRYSIVSVLAIITPSFHRKILVIRFAQAPSLEFLTTSITNNTTHKTVIERRRELTRPPYITKLTNKPTNAYFLLLRHHDRRRRTEKGEGGLFS